MSVQQVVVQGRIQPGGRLEVDQKVDLPPGPVSVTLQTVPAAARKPTLQVLEEIWAQRQARGMVGRSRQEIDAEIAAMRGEDEQRLQAIEAIGQRPAKGKE